MASRPSYHDQSPPHTHTHTYVTNDRSAFATLSPILSPCTPPNQPSLIQHGSLEAPRSGANGQKWTPSRRARLPAINVILTRGAAREESFTLPPDPWSSQATSSPTGEAKRAQRRGASPDLLHDPPTNEPGEHARRPSARHSNTLPNAHPTRTRSTAIANSGQTFTHSMHPMHASAFTGTACKPPWILIFNLNKGLRTVVGCISNTSVGQTSMHVRLPPHA